MPLFCFCHAQENAFAFFVSFTFTEIAVRLRSFDFRLPVAPCSIDRLLMIFLLRAHAALKRSRTRFPSSPAVYADAGFRVLFQSAGSIAALKAGSVRARTCCAVMMSA